MKYLKASLVITFCALILVGCSTVPLKHSVFQPQRTIKFSGMCSGFNKFLGMKANPKEEQYVFDLNDIGATWWGRIDSANIFNKRTLKVDWISPDGNIYKSDKLSTFNPYANSPEFISADLKIKGKIDASLQGEWKVKIYHEDELLDQKTFVIGKVDVSKISDNAIDKKTYEELNLADVEAVVLSAKKEVIVESDGTYKTHYYKKIKILKDKATKTSDIFIPFNSRLDTPDINKAYTITPEGKTIKAEETNRIAPLYQGYANHRSDMYLMISMPSVSKGAILEYDVNIFTAVPRIKDGFCFSEIIASINPVLYYEFSISFPKEMDLEIKKYNFNSDPSIFEFNDGKSVKYLWKFNNIQAFKAEELMPPLKIVLPNIRGTSFDRWDDVLMCWSKILKEKSVADMEIKTFAKDLVADCRNEEEKIRKIFDFVQKKMRYVAVKFGTDIYASQDIKDIFKNKYGDCKDKSAFLIALLKENDIVAYPAFVSNADIGPVDKDFPNPLEFDHVITLVHSSSGQIWLDPTNEYIPYGDLSSSLQGTDAYVIKEGDGYFTQLPTSDIVIERGFLKNQMKLNSNLSVEGQCKLEVYGAMGGELRYTFEYIADAETKDDMIRTIIDKIIPNAEIVDYDLVDYSDANKPFTIDVTYKVENWPIRTSGMIIFNPLFHDQIKLLSTVTQKREHPLYNYIPLSSSDIYEISLPENIVVEKLPDGIETETDFYEYKLKYKQEDNKIIVLSENLQPKFNISADRYPRIREKLMEINKVIREPIILKEVEKGM